MRDAQALGVPEAHPLALPLAQVEREGVGDAEGQPEDVAEREAAEGEDCAEGGGERDVQPVGVAEAHTVPLREGDTVALLLALAKPVGVLEGVPQGDVVGKDTEGRGEGVAQGLGERLPLRARHAARSRGRGRGARTR